MEKMRAAKTEMGLTFKQGLADQDVWQALTPQGEIAALVIVYVDDFLVVNKKYLQGHPSMVFDNLGNHPAIVGKSYIGCEIPGNGN